MRKLFVVFLYLLVFISTILVLSYFDNGNRRGSYNSGDVDVIAENSPQAMSSAPPLQTGMPEHIIFNQKLSAADELIQSDIDAGFPGAVLLVSLNGQTIFHKAYGHLKIYDKQTLLQNPQPMHVDTVFDLASLTKIYATTFALMKLADDGLICVDDPVYEYLPEFDKDEYSQISIRELLNHTSGLPSDVKFFRPDVIQGEEFYSTNRNITISLLPEVPLDRAPGEKQTYSDVGYMVLGAVIEKVTGMQLDEYVRKNIYEPMGLANEISFLPLQNGFEQSNIACTERLGNTRDNMVDFPKIRKYTLQGEVHDEKAYYSMGGVSGHAGLFANADAINKLNLMLMEGGKFNSLPLITEQTVDQFTSIQDELRYQLGFANAQTIESLKDVVPHGTLCHTGWTGTFSLIDKHNGLSIVLLTNKRHSKITEGNFEGALFDTRKYYKVVITVYESLGLAGN